jgi:hypothetical protein
LRLIEQFNIVVNNSLQENKTDPCMHLIEEMAELTVELCKEKRGRDHNFYVELSHVFFQLNKVIVEDGLTVEAVMEMCLKETKERFPHQLTS